MSPLRQAMTFLRNTIAASPSFGTEFKVINIEDIGVGIGSGTMVLDLDDGTTIRLVVERYPREETA